MLWISYLCFFCYVIMDELQPQQFSVQLSLFVI